MGNKKAITINEEQLKSLVYESLKRILSESDMGLYTFDCRLGVWCGKGGFNSGNTIKTLNNSKKFTNVGYSEHYVYADFKIQIDLSDLDIKFALDDEGNDFDDVDEYYEFEGEVLDRVYEKTKEMIKPWFGKTIKYFGYDKEVDLYKVKCSEIGFGWGHKMFS